MKKLILSLFFSSILYSLSATHIVGGSMSYRSLGAGQYEITMEVLRDCYNGNPAAFFDDPAGFGVFDDSNMLVDSFSTPFSGINDTISTTNGSNICQFPISVCIHRTIYKDTIMLPSNSPSYTIAYQRCCRPAVIANLVDPLDTGMTFFINIPVGEINDSPIFNNDFPVAVFTTTAFVYDGSAADADGDSLVYELVSSFAGGTPDNPQPDVPSAPPYDQIPFVTPTYSVDNMLGGNYPLTINSETGEMTAIPPITGQFQIAYAVHEYRNGEQISTTYREFIFIVIPPVSGQEYEVSGNVNYLGLSLGLNEAEVSIMERDIVTDSVSVWASQPIDADGNYSFSGIPPGVFYVKATVDPSSPIADLVLPTYFDNSPFWYEATTINQCDTSAQYRDISLLSAMELLGDHTLSGLVVYPDEEEVADLDLLLANEDDVFVESHRTNDQGYFEFQNLEAGTYSIYVDLLNSTVINENPLVVALVTDTALLLTLEETELVITGIISDVDNLDGKEKYRLKVFPNPTSESTVVELDLDQAGYFTVKLFDVYGTCVQTLLKNEYLPKGKTKSQLDFNNLSTGTYLLEVIGGEGAMVQKVIYSSSGR